MDPIEAAKEAVELERATERAFYEHGDGSPQWELQLSLFERHAMTHYLAISTALLAANERAERYEKALESARDHLECIKSLGSVHNALEVIDTALRASAPGEKESTT